MFSDMHEEWEYRLVEKTKKETAEKIYYLCKKDFIGLDEIGLKVLKSIIKNNFGVEIKE